MSVLSKCAIEIGLSFQTDVRHLNKRVFSYYPSAFLFEFGR